MAQSATDMIREDHRKVEQLYRRYQPVMRSHLTLSDEKTRAERYTTAGSGVTEVERPWCVEPVYQPDPRAVFRHPFLLPPSW